MIMKSNRVYITITLIESPFVCMEFFGNFNWHCEHYLLSKK